MTRRRRIVLVVLLVVVGIPILAAVGVGSYLRTGGLEREIAGRWTSYGMPGRLQVDNVRLIGLDEVQITGMSLATDGGLVMARAAQARIRIDLVDRRLVSARFEGVTGEMDAERLRLLTRIISVEASRPPTRAPTPVTIDVAGTLDLPGGTRVEGVEVHVEALGPATTTAVSGSIAGRPLRLTVSTARSRVDSPVVITIDVAGGQVDAAHALAAVVGLGLVAEPPAAVLDYLPGLVDAAGSQIVHDPVADTFRGGIRTSWDGGSMTAALDADRKRTVLDRIALADRRLGDLSGRIEIAHQGPAILVEASAWRAGAGLPLPPGLPLADVSTLLPAAQLRWPVDGRRVSLMLSGPGQARLEATFGGGAPTRLQAAELPLSLIQGFLPRPLVVGGGHAVSATATLADGRPDVSVVVRQARFLAEGWSFGPLDGRIAAVVVPGAGVQVSTDLLAGEQPIGRIEYSGTAADATFAVDCPAVEGLLARLRGPVQLPDLTGSLSLRTRMRAGPDGAMTVEVQQLALGAANLRLKGRELVRGLEAQVRGTATIAPRALSVDLGGHLRRGELRMIGSWVPVAARTPIFAVDMVAEHGASGLASLDLRRIIVRAADAGGEPVAGGWSAQLGGRLSGERLGGVIEGVVDHADLSWLADQLAPGQVKVAGEGAVTFRAVVDQGEIAQVAGSFLPLGADLDVDRGKVKVNGITGRVEFTVGGAGR